MKRLTAAQISLGFVIIFFSFVSITDARWETPAQGIIINEPNGIPSAVTNTPPPQSPGFAWATMFAGLAVVVCGSIQQKMAIKYSGQQVVIGMASALASIVLGLEITNEPWITGNIYYLSVLTFVVGVLVIVFGFLQSRLTLYPTKESRQ